MSKVLTVTEYNATQQGASMRFQNADGSFKKKGFVVLSDNGTASYFKTMAAAEAEIANPTPERELEIWEYMPGMSKEAAFNS